MDSLDISGTGSGTSWGDRDIRWYARSRITWTSSHPATRLTTARAQIAKLHCTPPPAVWREITTATAWSTWLTMCWWRNGGPLQNEVDNVGVVDAGDYTAWRARFGNTSGSGSFCLVRNALRFRNQDASTPVPVRIDLVDFQKFIAALEVANMAFYSLWSLRSAIVCWRETFSGVGG